MKITREMKASVPFRYANDVLQGRIVTGGRIRKAVERFFRWIESADEKGFYLDHAAGMKAIAFFPTFLNHTVGKFQGKPFHLAPFQQFTIYNVFGWKVKATGLRRVSRVYDRRAKKNGKTAEMAGVGLLGMSFDKEMSAQVYVGATKEAQAKLCWKQAKDFIESPVANPALRKMGFITRQNLIIFPRTSSEMRPLGGDSKTQDGINTHIGIIDEYHAHADNGVKENLESSTVLRAQPIIYHITTAGLNVYSVCKEFEDSLLPVLDGIEELDHLWIMIHEMDADDDWEDPANWIKANPLLGQGLEIDAIMKEFNECAIRPTKLREFKTKNLNMWVDQQEDWIRPEIWKRCLHSLSEAEVIEKFKTHGGYMGVDLASKMDIAPVVAVSNPDEFGDRYILPWFFVPKENIADRSKNDKVFYESWVQKGLMIATPGNVIDYDVIKAHIEKYFRGLGIVRVEFDPWNADQIMAQLETSGVTCGAVAQYTSVLSAPTKEFERLVYSGKLRHDGNPILAWMLAGCAIERDSNDNIRVHKGKSLKGSKRRIDGIPATINALAGSMTGPGETNESIYNDPNVDFVC